MEVTFEMVTGFFKHLPGEALPENECPCSPEPQLQKKKKKRSLEVAAFSVPGNYLCFQYKLFKSWEKISVGSSAVEFLNSFGF